MTEPLHQFDIVPWTNDLRTAPLEKGRRYRLIFRGTCIYAKAAGPGFCRLAEVDGGWSWLLPDGRNPQRTTFLIGVIAGYYRRPQEEEPFDWREDRKRHEYSCVYVGQGAPIQICWKADLPNFGEPGHQALGTVQLSIEPILTPKELAAHEKTLQEAAEVARSAAETERRELMRQRIETLKRTVRKSRNFLDPSFREPFVRNNFQQILSQFRSVWEDEYDRVFQDIEFVDLLSQEAPDALQLLELRLDMIQMSERFAYLPAEVPVQPIPAEYYEGLSERLESGEEVSIEPLRDRANDLFKEKVILEAKRRTAVKEVKTDVVRDIDQQLVTVRREIADIKRVLENAGAIVDVEDPHYRDESIREQSIEDQFFADYETERRIIEQLTNAGDNETMEAVKALYAERRYKIFQQDSGNYT